MSKVKRRVLTDKKVNVKPQAIFGVGHGEYPCEGEPCGFMLGGPGPIAIGPAEAGFDRWACIPALEIRGESEYLGNPIVFVVSQLAVQHLGLGCRLWQSIALE